MIARTFIALLTAHLAAKFVLQTDRVAAKCSRLAAVLAGMAAMLVLSVLTLGNWNTSALLLVLTTQAVLDLAATVLPATIAVFVAIESIQLCSVAAVALILPDASQNSWWTRLPTSVAPYFWQAMCLAAGVIACLPAGGVVIAKLMQPLTDEIASADAAAATDGAATYIAGLTNGSTYIGWLERALVMILILINQPAGVGFLITAKSILRFGDVKDSHQRKATEYIIIGTFMSFGWGLLVAVLTQRAVSHFQH